MNQHLIAYAKRPLPGYAKTRLGTEMGLEESAGVYARILYKILLELLDLDKDEIRIELSLASGSDLAYFSLAFPEFLISAQKGSDLGQRFTQSIKGAFESGVEKVVVIGTDIPDLDRSTIQSAFAALDKKEVVIGPDTDGGYYLIGTRQKSAKLFRNIDWSSEVVLNQTERLISAQGLSIHYLPILSDIDTDADYQRWLDSRV
ncbi:TIGR04282 family arsenosugar biosynthesis glycosyltransferase [Chloroflexota bacterium]